MKKMVLLLAVLMPLAFASCGEEENFPLNGTVWGSVNREIRFDKTTFIMPFDAFTGETDVDGTYTYISPKLVMTRFYADGSISSKDTVEIDNNVFKLWGELFYKR